MLNVVTLRDLDSVCSSADGRHELDCNDEVSDHCHFYRRCLKCGEYIIDSGWENHLSKEEIEQVKMEKKRLIQKQCKKELKYFLEQEKMREIKKDFDKYLSLFSPNFWE